MEAETLLSYGTIFKIINKNLKMKKIASRWVLHDLTEGNQTGATLQREVGHDKRGKVAIIRYYY